MCVGVFVWVGVGVGGCRCVCVCVFKEAKEGLCGVENGSDRVDFKQVRQDELERKNLFAYTGLVSASGTKRFS